jgi:Holliday junction DNA helicase RuvA
MQERESMIGMLSGVVDTVDSDAAIIDVSGVGFDVRMPSADLAAMHGGQEVKIYTSMNVSQDAITLYGFRTMASKRMFLQLQKVSGIGPRVALSLLSTLQPERLAKAVADSDATALAKAPGLGKKGAQKIILELKGSIDLDAIEGSSSSNLAHSDTGTLQVIEGLMSLGWRQQDAGQAVRLVCQDNDIETPLSPQDVPRVLKLALTSLDRGR